MTSGRRLTRQPNATLVLTVYGGSWVCDHLAWNAAAGAVLLPVPLDAAIVVDAVADPVDLEAADQDRIQTHLTSTIAGLGLHGATIVAGSVHECHRTARSVVYVGQTRPRPGPP